jgi:hypothetical protein
MLFKMPSKSVVCGRYTIPDFEGLKVRNRVALLEGLLPVPDVEDDAIMRACDALYAIGQMTPRLVSELKEEQRLSGRKVVEYWAELAVSIEAHFQGNLIATTHYHSIKQRKQKIITSCQRVLAKIRSLTTEAAYAIIEEFGMADDSPAAYYTEVLINLKAGRFNAVLV